MDELRLCGQQNSFALHIYHLPGCPINTRDMNEWGNDLTPLSLSFLIWKVSSRNTCAAGLLRGLHEVTCSARWWVLSRSSINVSGFDQFLNLRTIAILGNFMLLGAVLYIVGCFTASLVSIHYMPVAPPVPDLTIKNVSRHCQMSTELPPLQNTGLM